MSPERAHAQLLAQGERLAVVGFSLIALRKITPRRNVAEEAQGIRLVAAFLVLMGMRQRLLGKDLRLLQAACQHLRFSQEETTELLGVPSFHCRQLFSHLREQRYGVGDAPDERIRHTQGRSYPREIGWEVCFATETHGPFEQGQRRG